MVAAKNVGVDAGRLELGHKACGAEPIVYAPAGILFAGMETVGPPGVDVALCGEEVAEGVGEPLVEQYGELGALLVGEARIVAIAFGVLDVYLFVGYVHVAAGQHGLRLVEPFQVKAEGIVPHHALFKALEAVLRVGRIYVHQEDGVVLERDDAPLRIHVEPPIVGQRGNDVGWQTVGDRKRCVFRVDGGA